MPKSNIEVKTYHTHEVFWSHDALFEECPECGYSNKAFDAESMYWTCRQLCVYVVDGICQSGKPWNDFMTMTRIYGKEKLRTRRT